ncbi:MAG: Fe-S cluster assembly protein SufD [Planctomycetota bacterium]
MTTLTEEIRFDAAGFEALIAASGEPDWLIQKRRDAFEIAQSLDWPNRRHEEWIRTDNRAFQLEKYAIDGEADDSVDAGAQHQLLEGVETSGHVETVNSQIVSESLREEWADKGVVFGSLSRLAHSHADLINEYFLSTLDVGYDKFAALHAAFHSGSQFLYVPRGVVIQQPLHIGSVLGAGGVDTTHTLVVIDEGAQATVLHESNGVGESDAGLHLGGVELIQKPGSHLRYVDLQEWGHKTYHFAHQRAIVDRDAALQWTLAAMGSGLTKVNQSVDLVGKGADSQVNGVMFTEKRQHLAYHTLQHHKAANCHSDFLYKSAQQDRSRTVWRGMIKVDKGAQKTDGYQRNDNLVLSNTARADSIPGLEIEADDVRCTHGSTTAKVDEEQIFYARCRGFTRKEATRMIVTGFFQQIFDRITIDSVRDALGAAIARQVREYE